MSQTIQSDGAGEASPAELEPPVTQPGGATATSTAASPAELVPSTTQPGGATAALSGTLMSPMGRAEYTRMTNTLSSASRLITTAEELRGFLRSIPLYSGLYLDLEGFKLGRHGQISLMTILVYPLGIVGIIDMHVLGLTAFTTATNDGRTIKSLLEDPRYGKFLWDLRSDVNALWFLYGIRLDGVVDIQLLENYSRKDDKTYLWGLARAITSVVPLDDVERLRWRSNKQSIKRQMGKSSNLFVDRPLQGPTQRYCVNDVIHLPFLHWYYFEKLGQSWRYPAEVARATLGRVMDACSEEYVSGSRDLQYGPWGAELPG